MPDAVKSAPEDRMRGYIPEPFDAAKGSGLLIVASTVPPRYLDGQRL